MFENKNNYSAAYPNQQNFKDPLAKKNWIIIVFLLFIFLLVIFIFKKQISSFFVFNHTTNNNNTSSNGSKKDTSSLPSVPNEEKNPWLDDSDFSNVKVEELAFGSFYKHQNSNLENLTEGFKLPINAKKDVANFYELNRKIQLSDKSVEDLNKNGFSIIDDDLEGTNNDFFSAYKKINELKIPYLVTSDFIIYFYQNSIKEIFKNIESSVFYKEFWEVNKKLFEISDSRYRNLKAKMGTSSDPILEGQRLEALYFAMFLELLKPKSGQVSVSTDIVDVNKFTKEESIRYSFDVPSYLKEDIEKEKKIIFNESKKKVKSPIFKYEVDYSKFFVPADYASNSKLNNFYLASNWANFLFPLNYKDKQCPDCLLDYEDWKINQAAAQMISGDIAENQDLKNRWAKIYKIISFFKGLRAELTYLNYNQAFLNVFGKDRTIESVFSNENVKRDKELADLKNEIAKISFDEALGGFTPDKKEFLKLKGLKVLQDNYWPEEYLANQLIFDYVGFHNTKDKKTDPNLKTSCGDYKTGLSRCRYFNFDIINLVYNKNISNPYFLANINYENYSKQKLVLQDRLNKFNDTDWHNNNFWTSLYTNKVFLNSFEKYNQDIYLTDAWNNRCINTSLGYMTNLQLQTDKWIQNIGSSMSSALGGGSLDSNYNLVEPNLELIDELISNTQFMFKSLLALSVVKENNNEFNNLLIDLSNIKNTTKKEISKKEIDEEEWKKIYSIISKYKIEKIKGATNLIGNVCLEFKDYSGKHKSNVYKSCKQLNKAKLIILVKKNLDGKLSLVVGPVFNYKDAF